MSEVRKPVNTTERERKSVGAGMLAEAMSVGTSAAIEGQEAAGQREMLFSDVLPTKGLERERFEALGFKVGEPVDEDPLFTGVELPDGWSREGSDHAMWSYIVDERKRHRVSVFYKAAFYDRKAEVHMETQPKTAAQEAAVAAFYEEGHGFPKSNVDTSMDGDTLVIVGRPLEKGDDGRPIHLGGFGSGWQLADVDPIEKRIAMDGSET
jgi:hypothetical protein